MKTPLTPAHMRLASHLLRMAADEFGNHGCNDFNLEEVMPDEQERRDLMKLYHEMNGDPEEFNPKSSYKYTFDFGLMSLMADLLDSESSDND